MFENLRVRGEGNNNPGPLDYALAFNKGSRIKQLELWTAEEAGTYTIIIRMHTKVIQNLAKLKGLEPAERIAAATAIAYNGI